MHHETYHTIDASQWNLKGKVVFITGASRGIGRSTAIPFARAGVSGIAIGARSTEALEEVENAVIRAASQKHTACSPRVLKLGLDVTEGRAEEISQAQAEFDMYMDSTKRKRRRKMKKHKYVQAFPCEYMHSPVSQAEEAQTGTLFFSAFTGIESHLVRHSFLVKPVSRLDDQYFTAVFSLHAFELSVHCPSIHRYPTIGP